MSSPLELSLTEAAGAIARGDVSSVELTESALRAAEASASKLNCFIRVDAEGALAAARQADRLRADNAGDLPLLHGVPLAHKDMFYRAGEVCTCGSKIRADFRPSVTASALERLDAAGSVTLGTLNMAEFATGPTGHNPHYGACRNPWNTDYITGGSSSGAGSATGARIVYGALGSDTGGSVRLPAAACGLFGLKPTQTRVPRFGAMGLSFSLDNIGPLARTARDCARLLGVIAGPDIRDPTSSHFKVADYELATRSPNVNGLRIGIPRQYFRDELSSEVESALDAALNVYESLGAKLIEVDVPFAEVIGDLGGPISAVEALTLHRQWIRDRASEYGAQTLARHTSALAVPAADYLASIQARPRVIRQFVESVFSRCDVLQVPVFPASLPTIAETDVGDQNGFEGVLAHLTRNTRPFNYLALPALSVPAGFCSAGLPMAFQLVGRPFGEARLLGAGAAYEAATEWTTRRPPALFAQNN
jgi:aspartyl-tRNA(Asn)/glutamyl-tRNA(Gln) amidotransferase subunit A